MNDKTRFISHVGRWNITQTSQNLSFDRFQRTHRFDVNSKQNFAQNAAVFHDFQPL